MRHRTIRKERNDIKFSNNNATAIVIAIILGLAILGFGMISFNNSERNREEQRARALEQQQKLESCIATAQKEFNTTFTLNSDAVPGETYRTWKSLQVESSTTKKFNDDRELCVKYFGR